MTETAANRLRRVVSWLNSSRDSANDAFPSIEDALRAWSIAMASDYDALAEDVVRSGAMGSVDSVGTLNEYMAGR